MFLFPPRKSDETTASSASMVVTALTNKTHYHGLTEMSLKVALSTTTLTPNPIKVGDIIKNKKA
jgi:hypothetical protein